MSKHRILLTTIVVISALASVMLLRRSGAKFDAGETRLREQSNELAVLNTEHERLSNLAAQPKTNGTENELGKLRAKAEMLKKQTNHLDRAQAKTDNSQRPPPASSSSAQHTPEYYEQLRQLAGSRPTEARDLGRAFGAFADDQKRSPTSLDDLSSYLAQFNATLSGSNQYEFIYQGSPDQLKGLPWGSIAVIRDQQPWPGPDGTMMRVYGFPDGHSQMIIDNLQPWLSEHVIAPPASQ